MNQLTKQLTIYILGVFLLALGISFSIKAALGVSPVSSLSYAFSLITGISIGLATFLANVLYLIIEAIIMKKIEWIKFSLQLSISFLMSLFLNVTFEWMNFLPESTNLLTSFLYLTASLVSMSIGIFIYLSAQLPVTPYEGMLLEGAKKYKQAFSRIKIIGDSSNVIISFILCIIFTKSLGSIGIGTFIGAYLIGKLIGIYTKYFKEKLLKWLFHEDIKQP